MKAIIVGAGLAGLTAGYKLKQAGWQVTVLEVSHYAGGRAATVHDGGYAIDTGATQITSGYKEYLALCDEVGLTSELIDCSQIVGIVRGGRIHELDGSNILSGPLSSIISWRSKLSLLNTIADKLCMKPRLHYLDISDCHQHDTESIADYARRSMTAEAYEYLAAPLLRGNFQRNPDKASKLDWFAILDNFVGQKMLAVRGGIARLPTVLASQLDTHLNSPVQRVEKIGDKVAVSWIEQGVECNDSADACVIATRLPEAVAISPAYASTAAVLNQKLYYSRGLLVHLGFRKTTHSKVLGIFLPQQEQQQISLIWMEHNKSPECAPAGHSLITCYFDAACRDDYYSMLDDKAIDVARNYLEQLFPELKGQCDLSRVSRWPLEIPFPEPGVYREIHKLKQQLLPSDRIQYAADYFTCTGQNSAIHYGQQAAENLIRYCG
jgi:protoporphyrinogen/coproporphyrinogen III oxidase